jgi:hypothetical protein
LHNNVDGSKIVLVHDPLSIITLHRILDEWPHWRDLALPPERVKMVADNNITRFGAPGYAVYSPKHSAAANEIFSRLELSNDRHLLVAYTSSADEYFSNINLMRAFGIDLFQKEQPFSDQAEWLDALIDHVENSDHLQLVVRVHPREGKNQRDSRNSEHLAMLLDRYSGSFKHVRIIWPEDPTSSYDLAELASVVLTSWTNITLELARLGIPVLTAFKRYVPYPVGDVVQWAPTPAEYFKLLEEMITWPADLDTIRFSYRWSSVYVLSMAIDFGDVISAAGSNGAAPFRLSAAAPLVEDILVRGMSTTQLNRDALASAQSREALTTETEALRRQLRRTIWFLLTGEDRSDDYRLLFGDAGDHESADVVISPGDDFLRVRLRERVFDRRSAVIRRLAALSANVVPLPVQELRVD